MFTAALFMIAKIWVQPKGFQSTDEWVKKWIKSMIFTYIHTSEHSSGKKKKILPFVTTWTDLEDIVLSERSEIEKDKYHMISLMAGPEPCRDNGT